MKKIPSKLNNLIAKYKEELSALEARRNTWQKDIKPLILKVFTNFAKKSKLDLNVGVNTNLKNLEVVFIAFNNLNSGIANTQNQQIFIKNGGALMYAQQANGKITSFLVMPFIENLKGTANNLKELDSCHLHEINEDVILGDLVRFMQEMLDWECFLREPIGFTP